MLTTQDDQKGTVQLLLPCWLYRYVSHYKNGSVMMQHYKWYW